jgi:DNA repair exonuclease SbcCD ATPase subunit
MAPETIRLVSETSTSSQVQTTINTLFVAIDNLHKARDARVSQHQNERIAIIHSAATDFKLAADAAHAVQRQADLQNHETKFNGEIAAIDYMSEKIEERRTELGYSNPGEMIAVLTERIEELERRSQETETRQEEFESEIKKLQQMKHKLENMVKVGQVPQTTQLPQTTPPPQVQQPQARRPPRTRRR